MRSYLIILGLLIPVQAVAQLLVGSEGMIIQPGATISFDGLTLTPSTTLTIDNNSIRKNSTPLAGSPSINRLYQFASPLLFSGTAGINYLTSELNGYTESTLQLAYAPAANTALTVTSSSTVNTATHYVSNTLTNQNLFGVTATALSDLRPLLYARPTTINGTSPFSIVVDVVEVNSVTTTGSLTVKITKDAKVTLSFAPGATSVGSRSVQNSVWSFNGADPNYYVLNTSQTVAAGDRLSFGLTGMLNPGATAGVLVISAILLPTGLTEASVTNNSDADRVEYFQQ